MSEVIDKVDVFLKQFDELEELTETSRKNCSEVDLKISAWYHKVEGIEIKHISESHNLLKEVKELLKKRRQAKIEYHVVKVTTDLLRDRVKNVKGTKNAQIKKHSKLLIDLQENAK